MRLYLALNRYRSALFFSGIFFLTFELLLLETLSIRAAHVAFGQDFLFFIIPLTFLGLAAGAAAAYLTDLIDDSPTKLSRCAIVFAVLSPAQFLLVHLSGSIPKFYATILFFSLSFIAYAAAAWILAAILKSRTYSTSRIYFFDLFGAAAGTLAAAYFLNALGYESAVAAALVLALLPALMFSFSGTLRWYALFSGGGILLLLGLMLLPGPRSLFGIACSNGNRSLYTSTNSFSQINVEDRALGTIQELGSAPPVGRYRSYMLNGDCGAFGSVLISADSYSDISFLEDSLRSLPLAFQQARHGAMGEVFVPNAGAGTDVMRAQLFAVGHIDATEFNPAMLSVAERFSSASTFPYSQTNVTLYVADTRRFIETSTKKYDLILLSKAGLYGNASVDSSSPSYSITVEAMNSFLDHIAVGGIFSYVAPVNTTPIQPITAALLYAGIDPAGRIAYIKGRAGSEDLVIATKEIISPADRRILEALAARSGFAVSFPDTFAPPGSLTDDNPFARTQNSEPYTPDGLRRTLAMIALASLAVLLIAVYAACRSLNVSLLQRGIAEPIVFALYFAAIGFGFTFFELGIIEKSLFLIAEPSYAVAIILATLLVFGGLGSLATRGGPWSATSAMIGTLVICTFMLLGSYFGDAALHLLLPLSFPIRAICLATILALPSFALGMFLPLGLYRIGERLPRLTAWAWAVDGAFSVAGGLAANTLFHLSGLHTMYAVTAIAYMGALLCFGGLVAYQKYLK